jgi:hypothetical protein
MEQLSLFDFEEDAVENHRPIRFSAEVEDELTQAIGRALLEFYTLEGNRHDKNTPT